MKKLLLSIAILFALSTNAQTKEQALKEASNFAAASGNPILLNSKEFVDDHLFAVRFVPAGMTGEQYSKLDETTQQGFLTVVYKTIDKDYKLDRISGSYDVLYNVWQSSFSKDKTAKDNQNKKYFDKEKQAVYYFSEDNDERWVINYQPLQ